MPERRREADGTFSEAGIVGLYATRKSAMEFVNWSKATEVWHERVVKVTVIPDDE